MPTTCWLRRAYYPFYNYVESLKAREKRSRAVENLLSNKDFIHAVQLADEALERGEEHPKVAEVVRLLSSQPGKSAIVFVAVPVHHKDACQTSSRRRA